jgi:WD40 repeat protein
MAHLQGEVSKMASLIRTALLVVAVAAAQMGGKTLAGPIVNIYPDIRQSSLVFGVAFSPDGRFFASGVDTAIKVTDMSSGRELVKFLADENGIFSLSYSPKGNLIAVSSVQDNRVLLWNAMSGAHVATYNLQTNSARYVAFSTDGGLLAAGTDEGPVELWDVARGVRLRRFEGHDSRVNAVAFSRDGRLMAAASTDKTVIIWNVSTGAALETLSGHSSWVQAIAFSPDGRTLASGSWDQTVKIWDVPSGHELRTLSGHTGRINTVQFTADGKTVLSAGDKGIVELWDLASGNELRTISVMHGMIKSIALSPDGRRIAVGSDGVTLWDFATGSSVVNGPTSESRTVYSAAFSQNGTLLATGAGNGSLSIWNVITGSRVRAAASSNGELDSVAFSPAGDFVAAGGDNSVIDLWDGGGEHVSRRTFVRDGDIMSLAFSPSGAVLASGTWNALGVQLGGDNGGIQLWDAISGRRINTLTAAKIGIFSLAFSPSGDRLAAGSGEGLIEIWDPTTGTLTGTLSGHKDAVYALAFCPDGRFLVSGGRDGIVALWDTKDATQVRTFGQPDFEVRTVSVSRDGKLLAVGYDDATTKLWNLGTGALLHTFVGQVGWIHAVDFSPDGRELASTGEDATVNLWDVVSGRERAQFVAFDDGSSVVVTPEGFFSSSSEQAEENLNVRVGEHVFGISAFRENFYRPDLVQRSLAGEDISSFGDISKVQLSPQIQLGNAPPRTGAATLRLPVKLTDLGGGMGAVRVFEGGTVVLQDDTTGAASRSYRAPLLPGANDVRVAASNTAGDMWSEATIHVERTAPANDNAQAQPAKGVLHAVVVGIDGLPAFPASDDVNKPIFAGADAQLFADTLRQASGSLFSGLDIKVLTGADATSRTSIEQALKAMQASVGPNDGFVFFVASHGMVRGGEYYVLTSNTAAFEADALSHQALSRREITDLLANIHTSHKAAFIDTCQAGALGGAGQQFATRGMDPKTAATIGATVISRQLGLTMLMASSKSEEAHAGYQNHGLFTWVLTQGLAGQAADPATGLVTPQTLGPYVDTNVPQLAQSLGLAPQTPADNQAGRPFPIAAKR